MHAAPFGPYAPGSRRPRRLLAPARLTHQRRHRYKDAAHPSGVAFGGADAWGRAGIRRDRHLVEQCLVFWRRQRRFSIHDQAAALCGG